MLSGFRDTAFPTSSSKLLLMVSESGAPVEVFHLWPGTGARLACVASCPTQDDLVWSCMAPTLCQRDLQAIPSASDAFVIALSRGSRLVHRSPLARNDTATRMMNMLEEME